MKIPLTRIRLQRICKNYYNLHSRPHLNEALN